jgi:hypothetical protein
MTSKMLTRVGFIALFMGSGLLAGVFTTAKAHGESEEGHNGFTNRDFRGSYGMLENGQAGGLPFVEISVVRSDGAGHISIEAIGNIGGQTGIHDTLACTYQVRPNGMGHLACHSDATGETTEADFVLVDGGREVRIITTPNEEGYTYSTARRQ